jgi:hypothetical protein
LSEPIEEYSFIIPLIILNYNFYFFFLFLFLFVCYYSGESGYLWSSIPTIRSNDSYIVIVDGTTRQRLYKQNSHSVDISTVSSEKKMRILAGLYIDVDINVLVFVVKFEII